jgi:methyl-accepting chemotaxis protein
MADSEPAASPRDPLDNVISLVAGPIAAVIRSFDQLRRSADDLLKGLESFNRTMQNLNATAERVNSLLNEFEEPVREMVPKVVRTVSVAEDVANRVGPLSQLAEAAGSLLALRNTVAQPVAPPPAPASVAPAADPPVAAPAKKKGKKASGKRKAG